MGGHHAVDRRSDVVHEGRQGPGRGSGRDGTPPGLAGVPVQVTGLDRTGTAVALALAAAGADALALWDPAPVREADLGTGLGVADLGRRRADAAERRLAVLAPRTRVFAQGGPAPRPLGALTVDVGSAAGPEFAARALAAEHPVLPLVASDDLVRVGPWTAAGLPGCLLCTDGPPEDGSVDPSPEDGTVDPVTALRAAVLVVDVLRGDVECGAGVVLHADPRGIRPSRVLPRPGCACAGAVQAVAGPCSSSITSWP